VAGQAARGPQVFATPGPWRIRPEGAWRLAPWVLEAIADTLAVVRAQ